MKQTILAALLLASTTSLFAQKETEKIEFRPHWYMQVQGGIGHTIGEGKFSDLVSPAAALSAGYRFTPCGDCAEDSADGRGKAVG